MEALNARSEITKSIKNVCEENGIKNYTITDVKTNQKGEGYLGQIFLVSVKDTSNGKQMEMVIKVAFNDEKVREMVPIRMSFQNEIYFYSTVYRVFMKFEKEQGIIKSDNFAPKCFKVSVEDEKELLILENLRSSGFEIFDKTLILDEDHVKLIFKTYGRFHGYSFALRDQKPEEFEKMAKNFHNIYAEFIRNGIFVQHFQDIGKLVEEFLIPGEDDEIIKKYQKYVGINIVNIFDDIVTKDLSDSAILHGDCWSNNMMFKYEDTSDGKRPVDMRLIDWQLIKVGSPVCDLSYCLYSGASKKVFDNLNEYLHIYYDSFSSIVKKLGSDPDKLFSFSTLKEHWKKYSKFGMIMAFTILKMKLTHKEDLVDLTDGYDEKEFQEVMSKQKFDETNYRRRVRTLLWHMSEVDAL